MSVQSSPVTPCCFTGPCPGEKPVIGECLFRHPLGRQSYAATNSPMRPKSASALARSACRPGGATAPAKTQSLARLPPVVRWNSCNRSSVATKPQRSPQQIGVVGQGWVETHLCVYRVHEPCRLIRKQTDVRRNELSACAARGRRRSPLDERGSLVGDRALWRF